MPSSYATVLPQSGPTQVECCFTYSETIRTIRDWEPGTATLTFTQLQSSKIPEFSVALRPQRLYGLLGIQLKMDAWCRGSIPWPPFAFTLGLFQKALMHMLMTELINLVKQAAKVPVWWPCELQMHQNSVTDFKLFNTEIHFVSFQPGHPQVAARTAGSKKQMVYNGRLTF